jgi:predicted dehydrogenase
MSIHILVVGVGSVGKRHARNLSALGCKISCVDVESKRVQDLAEEIKVIGKYNSINSAFLSDQRYDGAVIASPTGSHSEALHQLANFNLPILLEKPVAKSLTDATKMSQVSIDNDIPVLLGYTWRWWKPLQRVQELIKLNAIGSIRHVQFNMSAHLADWHPWEPYQSFFMASAAQGGGALLDESHWIDMMIWFFGMPEKILGSVEKISDLEIETDDNVDVIAFYPNGLRVTIHLDLYGRPHEKSIRFVGENGTLAWSAEPNRIKVSGRPEKVWEEEIFDCDRNEMFVAVAEEFINLINGNIINLTCHLKDGLNVMKVIEMIKTSSNEGRIVRIEELS